MPEPIPPTATAGTRLRDAAIVCLSVGICAIAAAIGLAVGEDPDSHMGIGLIIGVQVLASTLMMAALGLYLAHRWLAHHAAQQAAVIKAIHGIRDDLDTLALATIPEDADALSPDVVDLRARIGRRAQR